MGTTATLEPLRSEVEAGREATVTLSLRNDSDIVEEYSIRVVGDCSDWARVEPPEVTVYPGQSATAVVTLKPPRSSDVPAGEHPYGVHVRPAKRPANAAVPEGVVELLPFYETVAEFSPQTARGKGAEQYRVSVTNRGNAPVAVALVGKSASDDLGLTLGESRQTVEPGTTWTSELRAEPTERLWRGTPTAYPFTVMVLPEEGPDVALAGTQYQEPVLPAWLFKALLALLVLAALLVGASVYLKDDPPPRDSTASPTTPISSTTAPAPTSIPNPAPTQPEEAVTQPPTEEAVTEPTTEAAVTQPPAENPEPASTLPAEIMLSATQVAPGEQLWPETAPEEALRVTSILLDNLQGATGVFTLQQGFDVLGEVRFDSVGPRDNIVREPDELPSPTDGVTQGPIEPFEVTAAEQVRLTAQCYETLSDGQNQPTACDVTVRLEGEPADSTAG